MCLLPILKDKPLILNLAWTYPSLFVDQYYLCSSKAVGTVGAWVQVDHSHPGIDEASILPGAYVLSISAATREQPVVASSPSALQPLSQRIPRSLCDLERHRATGLLLDNRRSLSNDAALSDITEPKLHQVTAPQFGVQRDVEHR